jgi:AcrR family transcriptional regulator
MSTRRNSSPDDAHAPDGRRERWRRHREQRRAELIDAVADAVERRGAEIGMDEIAAETQIAKPVFYRYFADKADLHRAVGQTYAAQLVVDVTAAIDAEQPGRAALAAGIECYLAIIEERQQLYRFVVHAPSLALADREDVTADFATEVGRHAARVIGDARRAAGLDAGPAEPWGAGIVGMARAAGDAWLARPTMSRTALAGYLTDLVWPGLGRDAADRDDRRTATRRGGARSQGALRAVPSTDPTG